MQQGHAAKGPRTRPALVLLHLGVGLQVGSEVGAVCEGTVAVLAREGALTCDGRWETLSTRETLLTKRSVVWLLFLNKLLRS